MLGTVTIVESTGEPFTSGESGLAKCLARTTVSKEDSRVEATCTLTEAKGSEIFSRWEGAANGGKATLLSGSGKYTGVYGTCDYSVQELTDGRMVVVFDCAWEKT